MYKNVIDLGKSVSFVLEDIDIGGQIQYLTCTGPLSNRIILTFSFFFSFFTNILEFRYIVAYKNETNFQKSDCRYGFLVYGMFFALFLGINSDKFHYNSVSSKRAVIFCSIK